MFFVFFFWKGGKEILLLEVFFAVLWSGQCVRVVGKGRGKGWT